MNLPKRNIVRFEDNNPTSLILDTEPTKARGKTREGNYGPFTSYLYYTKGGEIFFASESLHNQLQTFLRGDEVTITKDTKDERTKWIVKKGGNSSARKVNNLRDEINLDALIIRVEKLENKVFNNKNEETTKNNEEDTEDSEIDDSELGF